MKIVSLFDGMACGYEALNRVKIPVESYYASEIDKYAIQIAMKNHPEIIQIGDVKNVSGFDYKDVDLLMGGSPCQGFSFAGKQLNFGDPRSQLFFEYVRILKEMKPKYFLLENVKMKKQFQDIISNLLGVEPIEINSSLVSAQNRKRLYWTNIPGIEQPNDKGILLKEIVLKDAVFLSPREQGDFTVCMHNLYGGFGEKQHRAFIEKSPTLRTAAGGGHIPSLLLSEKAIAYMDREISDGRTHWDFGHHSDVRDEKSATVVANFFKGVPYNVLKDWNCIRKFDPIECERLQTLPDNYTEGVSNTQRYKMLGNGWTVDVIAWILSHIPKEEL